MYDKLLKPRQSILITLYIRQKRTVRQVGCLQELNRDARSTKHKIKKGAAPVQRPNMGYTLCGTTEPPQP